MRCSVFANLHDRTVGGHLTSLVPVHKLQDTENTYLCNCRIWRCKARRFRVNFGIMPLTAMNRTMIPAGRRVAEVSADRCEKVAPGKTDGIVYRHAVRHERSTLTQSWSSFGLSS